MPSQASRRRTRDIEPRTEINYPAPTRTVIARTPTHGVVYRAHGRMVVYTNRKGTEFMYILDYQAFITLVFRLFWLSIYLVSKYLIFNAFTFTYYKSETVKRLIFNDIKNKNEREGASSGSDSMYIVGPYFLSSFFGTAGKYDVRTSSDFP